ncbi:MAG: S8 family peptidase [Bacteroidetes bacterium]|nr:S8 family peptidase [Bacteroidota bacterium]
MNLLKKTTYILLLFLIFSSHVMGIGDSTRKETRILDVYNQYGLSGEGVIVAIIDRGVDYRHPDFIDENGNTRIAYIFDMLDNTGMNDPDNPYGVGTIFDSTEINNALLAGGSPVTMDWYGHGTASTGIAAGNGSGITSKRYQGVAHKAKIIVVKAFVDYFPPFGSHPGQNGFFDPNYLEIALDFVADKTDELGLPSVTLMNLGSIGGPTDGTSKVCRAMDDFTATGRLLVCGVGDDGGGANRASGMVSQGDTASLEIHKGNQGNLRFELWYEGNDRFDIIIEKPNGTIFGPFVSPVANSQFDNQFLTGLNYYHRGSDQDFSQATNGKRQLMIDITQDTGIFKIKVIGATVSDGSFSASLNPANFNRNNEFLTYVQTGGSINDYASAFNVITPTDYVVKNTWIDIDGFSRARINEGDPGELWVGSSEGPTLDGRIGIDVAAPGEVLFTSYSPGTWYSQYRFLMIEDGEEKYGLQNAVSAASPLVTGVLALMLELDPELTPQRARDILRQTARSDAFTGAVPNNSWGHGKLDALAAIEEVDNPSSILPRKNTLQASIAPNPFGESFAVELSEPITEPYEIFVYDLRGIQILHLKSMEVSQNISLPGVAKGVYLTEVRYKGKRKMLKMIKD